MTISNLSTASLEYIDFQVYSFESWDTTGSTTTGSAPQENILYASSDPDGANLYLDAAFQGTCSLTVSNFTPGVYSITSSYTGYSTYFSTFSASAGTNNLKINLVMNPLLTGSSEHAGRPTVL